MHTYYNTLKHHIDVLWKWYSWWTSSSAVSWQQTQIDEHLLDRLARDCYKSCILLKIIAIGGNFIV